MLLFRTQSYITLLDILQCKVSSTLCNIQEFLYFLKLKHILLKQIMRKLHRSVSIIGEITCLKAYNVWYLAESFTFSVYQTMFGRQRVSGTEWWRIMFCVGLANSNQWFEFAENVYETEWWWIIFRFGLANMNLPNNQNHIL